MREVPGFDLIKFQDTASQEKLNQVLEKVDPSSFVASFLVDAGSTLTAIHRKNLIHWYGLLYREIMFHTCSQHAARLVARDGVILLSGTFV